MKQHDVEKSLIVQKNQVDQSVNKLTELKEKVDELTGSVDTNKDNLKSIDQKIDSMFRELGMDRSELDLENVKPHIDLTEKELTEIEEKLPHIPFVDFISMEENTTWDVYINSVENYANRNEIDLSKDPFELLLTPNQKKEIEKRLKEEFTFKNALCDKYDYMIAGTCGVIGGLIDVLFVGIPEDSKLGNIADEHAKKVTEKFAEFLGWNKNKAIEKGKNTTASAIGFLENKYRINYDQATTHATDGAVKHLSSNNHHLKSIGHSPCLIGLFFSILNQFTNTSTFINNGQLITINTETFELKGNNFVAKIFCGFANWLGHIMSDWTGSSGTVGQGGRGSGVPIPFYNLFQLSNFGRFGEKERKTFAMVTSEVFERGYDFRHGMAMAIPVLITELLIRFMWSIKSHYYHKNSWKDSIPFGNNPELRRMLLMGHGTLCIIDGADACIRSGGEMVKFLLRTNLLAWVRFGQLSLKELNVWYNAGHIDIDAVDKYLEIEYRKMLLN